MGFKTAQKIINLEKKENNNKDYRSKEKAHIKYSFLTQKFLLTIYYVLNITFV